MAHKETDKPVFTKAIVYATGLANSGGVKFPSLLYIRNTSTYRFQREYID